MKKNDETTVSNPDPNIQIIAEPISFSTTLEPNSPVSTSKVVQPIQITPISQTPKLTSCKTILGFPVLALLVIFSGIAVWRKKQ